MAACLRESTARVHFSVCSRPLCSRMLATVLMLALLLSRLVFKAVAGTMPRYAFLYLLWRSYGAGLSDISYDLDVGI